jgi:hypothetical protein
MSGENFKLLRGDLSETDSIAFAALGASGTVSWEARLVYQTVGGRGATRTTPYIASRSFQTNGTASQAEVFSSMGGRVTVRAQTSIAGVAKSADPKIFTITGTDVPRDTTTAQLVALYATGATPRLMTGIAMHESSYHHFVLLTKFNRRDFWPNESYDGGSHIGLMQIPTTSGLSKIWSWKENAALAVALFREKLASAARISTKIRQTHPGLRALNDVELENFALILYGPHADSSLTRQYYIPVERNGKWVWVENSEGAGKGIAYAKSVRNGIVRN